MADLGDGPAAGGHAPSALLHSPPYPASPLDHFFGWVRKAPVPAWLIYAGLWVLLFLLFSGLGQLTQTQLQGHFLLIATDGSLFVVYYVSLMHYLDTIAGRALLEFRPLLQVNDDEFAHLRYQLTTLPAWRTLLIGTVGALITMVGLRFIPNNTNLGVILRYPITRAIYAFANAVFCIFIYHTVRQLRFVTRLHGTLTHVNLFRRSPLYAFSKLTMRIGFGWILGLSVVAMSPRFADFLHPQELFLFWGPFLPLAALFFVLPLTGIHRLLAREKTRLQEDIDQRIEAVVARIHGYQDADRLGDLDGMKTLLDSLMVEREMVAKLPTWPWQPGTLAGFASALLIPLAVWLLQQLLIGWLPGR